MIFEETKLSGAYLIKPEPREDHRGAFSRLFCEQEFKAQGLESKFVQSSFSFNYKKGTLRGMHFQAEPHEEVRLVRCTRGQVFDVIVDIRKDSSTYLQWYGVFLNEMDRYTLYVPKGFAHGFQTVTDNAEITYHMSEFYHPESVRGLRWDDPKIKIQWPLIENRVLSDADKTHPLI